MVVREMSIIVETWIRKAWGLWSRGVRMLMDRPVSLPDSAIPRHVRAP
jgi:hypothetical protein